LCHHSQSAESGSTSQSQVPPSKHRNKRLPRQARGRQCPPVLHQHAYPAIYKPGTETPLVAKLLKKGLETWSLRAVKMGLPVAACWPAKPRQATMARRPFLQNVCAYVRAFMPMRVCVCVHACKSVHLILVSNADTNIDRPRCMCKKKRVVHST